MNKKLSIIIPTLQKNINFLNQLTQTLVNDDAVGEVIIIDNSTKGYSFNDEKVRVIVPESNLFVNPAWNLGVKEAKYDFLGILNDDICIPEGFCSKILKEISDKIGVIGTNGYSMINKSYEPEIINDTSFTLEKTSYTTYNFGVMMFMHKDNYYEIPEDMNIFFGDDYLVFRNKKNKKTNYVIEGLKMYHYGSLSSKAFSEAVVKDAKLYRKYTLKFIDRLLSYERTRTKSVFRILGMNFSINRKDLRQENRICNM